MPGPLATLGTPTECSFGMMPSVLVAEPLGVFANGMPVATIASIAPFANIEPFGMCVSELNPEVIAATAAAMGVLIPMPCIPVPVAPWEPPTNVMIDGVPAVTIGSVCECAWGGVIAISGPSAADNVMAV